MRKNDQNFAGGSAKNGRYIYLLERLKDMEVLEIQRKITTILLIGILRVFQLVF